MYKINRAEESDLDKLAKIMAESFTAADSDKPWDYDHAYDYLKYWYKKQPDMFFAAYDESENPVGAVAVNIKPWRTGVRCSDGVIFTEINNQKKGVATLLLKKVLEEAMDKYDAKIFEAVSFAGDEFPLTWFKKIDLRPDDHAVLIKGDCRDILSNLS